MYSVGQPYYGAQVPVSTREYYVYPEDYPADSVPVYRREQRTAFPEERVVRSTERILYPRDGYYYASGDNQAEEEFVEDQEAYEEEAQEEDEVAALQKELSELKNERDTLRQKLETREDSRGDGSRKETEHLRESLREMEAELLALRKERDQLRRKAPEMDSISRDLRNGEEEIARLRSERDQLEEALHQAQADFDELSAQFNLLSSKETDTFEITRSSPHIRKAEEPVKPRLQLKTGRKIHSEIERELVEKEHEDRVVAAAKTSPPRGGRTSADAVVCAIVGIRVDVFEDPFVKEEGRVVVKEIVPGSLAEKAGLRVTDVIEKWNRRVVTTEADWKAALSSSPRGACVRVGVYRQGIRKQVLIGLP